MGRLARDDQAEFVAVKRLCYSGLDSVQLRTAVSDRLRQYLRADYSAFLAADPATSLPIHAIESDVIPGACEAAEERALLLSPAFDYGARIGDTRRAYLVDQLIALGQGDQDPYLREVLLAFGFRHEAQVHFVAGGRVWGGLHFSRRNGRDAFENRDLNLLEAIAPHVAEGLRNAAARAALAAVPSSEVGVAVLGPDGQIEVVNGLAERLLGAEPARRPPSGLRAARMLLRLLTRDLLSDRLVPSVTIVDDERGESYRVRAERARGSDGRPRGLIFIEPARPADRTEALRDLGLTEREAEVALAIVRGRSTSQIAAALVVSPYTVQDHVRNICNKLGVGSRRELAALLLGVTTAPKTVPA